MSSTSNVQNYLSNVFRPYYVYDSNTGYQANLAISNVTSVTQEVIETEQLLIGDSNQNVYVGTLAGNDPAFATEKVCCNVTAVGYGAGNLISNVSNSVYVGTNAGAGAALADSVIAIGAGAVGRGTSNIYIGRNAGPATNGSGNIFIGNAIAPAGTVNNTMYIGRNSNYTITADLSNKWVGIGTNTPTRPLDVSGNTYISGNLTVQGDLSAGSVTFNIGKLMTINGTAPVPSHTFSNDVSSGMYLQGTSQVAFSTAGVQRMCISGANVNIAGNLTVQGDISAANIGFNVGKVTTINGSAPVPSYTFSNDASSGMYLQGTSQVAFSTAGVQRVVISNSNVGIGTATPARVLDVSGDISGSRITVLNGTAAAPTHAFNTDLTSGMYLQAASQVGFATGGVQRVVISNSNVGIGTATPATPLDVNGGTTFRGDISTTGILYFPNASGKKISLSNQAASTSNYTGFELNANEFRTAADLSSTAITFGANANGGTGRFIEWGRFSRFGEGSRFDVSGVVEANAGTVSAPAYSFGADTSSGMYLQDVSQIGFATGGLQRMCISGNDVLIRDGLPTPDIDTVSTVSGPVTVTGTAMVYDGTIQYARTSSGIYTSTNSGSTWALVSGAPASNGLLACSTTTGSVIAAGVGGLIRYRTELGVWKDSVAPATGLNIQGIALNGSGSIIYVANFGGGILVGTFNTVTQVYDWVNRASALSWVGVVTNETGDRAAAVIEGGSIWYSDTSGVTWGALSPPGTKLWYGIASSRSGSVLVAVARTQGVWISLDFGVTWNQSLAAGTTLDYRRVACSSDGQRILVSAHLGKLYFTVNGGVTWFEKATDETWSSVSMSSNGAVSIAGASSLLVLNYSLAGTPPGELLASRTTLSSGSPSIPSYTFSNDVASGMYLQAESQVGFATAGVQRMCISGGNVGIGNAAPTQPLSVTGNVLVEGPISSVSLVFGAATSRDSTRTWRGVASSWDGSNMIAGVRSAGVYRSTNRGSNWSLLAGSPTGARAVASSADGRILYAAQAPGAVYRSTDSGSTWSLALSNGIITNGEWYGITCSSNGSNVAAVDQTTGGYIYTSTNAGSNWTQRRQAVGKNWFGIASSSDGLKLIASEYAGYIYTSADGGVNWTQRDVSGALATKTWYGVASSLDGTVLAAGALSENSAIFISSNSGATWTARNPAGVGTNPQWWSFAMSSNGTTIAAVDQQSNTIYTSVDGGVNWTSRATATRTLDVGIQSVTLSKDGTIGAASVYDNTLWTFGATSNVVRGLPQIRPSGNIASTPAYAFSNDLSSGMFLQDVSQLAFSTGGVQRMCISGGNVGIGTTTPAQALQVIGNIQMGSGNNNYRQFSLGGGNSSGFLFGAYNGLGAFEGINLAHNYYNNNVADVIPNNGMRSSRLAMGAGSIGMYISPANNTAPTSSILYAEESFITLSTNALPRVRIASGGSVGVGTIAPAYPLDVSCDPATAALNMTTWPRTSISNTLILRGFAGLVSFATNWTTTANTINGNLMTVVSSNTSAGSSFRFLKNGIWSITSSIVNNANNQFMWIDVSTTDLSGAAPNGPGTPTLAMAHSGGGGSNVTLNWTGYLPSNTTYIYKLKSTGGPIVGSNTFSYVQVTLLNETPASGSAFPF